MSIRKPTYFLSDPFLLADNLDFVHTVLRVILPAAVVITRPEDKGLALEFSEEVVWAELKADALIIAIAISQEMDRPVLVITPSGVVFEAVYEDNKQVIC